MSVSDTVIVGAGPYGLSIAAHLRAADLPFQLFGTPLEPLPSDLITASAAAHVNRVFVAQADRTGTERGVDWAGASVIVDPDGRLLTAQADGEATLMAAVDLARAREKRFGDRNDVLRDRRPELYDELVGR